MRVNHYAFQEVNGWKDLNPKFVLQAWRDRQFAPDPEAYVRGMTHKRPLGDDVVSGRGGEWTHDLRARHQPRVACRHRHRISHATVQIEPSDHDGCHLVQW